MLPLFPSRRAFLALVAGAAISLASFPAVPAVAADVTVFAAASLKNALDDVAAAYKEKTGKSVVISYAASSALAKQIEAAAPADIFFSADLAWMDYLEERNLIQKDSRRTLLGNTLVLVAPADSTATVTLDAGAKLADLLGADGHLAMANVDSVPAGKYGKAALEKLGLWASVADRIVQADNVRAALAFVATGEAPLGIVYQTDANAEPKVKVVATFPADSHPPILYPVALTASSTNPDAKAFFDFMQSDAAKSAYEKQGFAFVAPAS